MKTAKVVLYLFKSTITLSNKSKKTLHFCNSLMTKSQYE